MIIFYFITNTRDAIQSEGLRDLYILHVTGRVGGYGEVGWMGLDPSPPG